ncbi:hypothetical protein NPX13_g8419 [Xylaria arbuscula]|uniref:Uncharacterized protein n=1 Tax=Xylaria arbuscula TaxID=114810 RepID=A0A9W8TIL8_9PEZI|nr:hypothetical protein NPX13_g8419 [Xylaria arbuscula]
MPGSGNSYVAGVTPRDGPYYVTVNGLHGFSVGFRGGEKRYVYKTISPGNGVRIITDTGTELTYFHIAVEAVEPNEEMFRSLAVAVNIGLEMLEKDEGRTALCTLGRTFVKARAERDELDPFSGDIDRMDRYVDHFLTRMRSDYPHVLVIPLPGSIIAQMKPSMPTSSLEDFQPKRAGGVTYNAEKVEGMVAVAKASMDQALSRKERAMYHERWQNFLFILACATAHETTHLFTVYLSLGADWPPTPTEICYSDYHQGDGGESGRWLEGKLFGGSLELFKHITEGPEHPGRPYIFGRDKCYHRIDSATIASFVNDPRRAIERLRGYSINIDDLRRRPSDASVDLRVTVNVS